MRTIHSEYQDPLDAIWLETCRRWGWKVIRSDQVFAAWDGLGTLTIGTADTLDPDDSLAQLILHEFCHAMVEGPSSWGLPDWGLDITDRSQLAHEHAALILQAVVSDAFGLRTFFGSTTDARRYYDRLPASAVELRQSIQDPASVPPNMDMGCSEEKSSPCPFTMAAKGLAVLRTESNFRIPLQAAFEATAKIATITQAFAQPASLWSTFSSAEDSDQVASLFFDSQSA